LGSPADRKQQRASFHAEDSPAAGERGPTLMEAPRTHWKGPLPREADPLRPPSGSWTPRGAAPSWSSTEAEAGHAADPPGRPRLRADPGQPAGGTPAHRPV